MTKQTTTDALRAESLDALRKFKAGEITRAELEQATQKLKIANRQMREDIRAFKAIARLETTGKGRPALPEGETMSPVSIYMKSAQKEKLSRLGGAPWVRDRIDKAREPKE